MKRTLESWTSCSLLLLAGCLRTPALPPELPSVSKDMPTVELVHQGAAINDSIDDRVMKIAVDRRGRVAVLPSMDGSPRIRFVDSSGHFRGGTGRAGPGPGELGGPGRIWWIADSLVVYETGRLVDIRYDPDGRLIRESPIRNGLVPLAASEVGIVELDYNWRVRGKPPVLTLRSSDGTRSRRVLDQRHPQLAQALAEVSGIATTYPWPIVAVRDSVLVLVEPRTPTIWYFTLAGQLMDSVSLGGMSRERGPMEFAEELDGYARASRGGTVGPDGKRYPGPDFDSIRKVLLADRPPVAFIHGANFDGHGRLWIIGPHRDSTRAIIVAGRQALGTITLPCFRVGRFVTVSDRWIALLCSKGEGADPPFELQLYRIVEPTAPPVLPPAGDPRATQGGPALPHRP